MNEGILCLGRGRLSGACQIDGEDVVVLGYGGALNKKRVLSDRKIANDGVISYCSDCFVFPNGKLEIGPGVKYEAYDK